MENINLTFVSTSVIAVTLVILAWVDAIRNDANLFEQFSSRFKKGLRLGFLLSLVGIAIAYANALQPGNEKVTLDQFIFVAILGGSIATMEIGLLNGLNPSPQNSKFEFFKYFVNIGWAVAIGIIGFTSVLLPYKLSNLIFSV